MPWTKYDTPAEFFGQGYDYAGGTISLKTAAYNGVTVGGVFQGNATTNTITTTSPHGLTVGDRVRVTQGTLLPSGLSENVDYYVLTVPSSTSFTLSSTRGGSTLALGTDGSSNNTVRLMGLLEEITDAEADKTSGDARKVIYGLLEALYTRFHQIPSADRSKRMVLYRTTTESTDGSFIRSYSVQFIVAGTNFDVMPED